MSDSVIAVENLCFNYNDMPVLEDINLSITKGEFVGIIGPNGGGKTTLLRMILGLLVPQQGSITVLGKKPSHARSDVGYMPQYSTVNSALPLTVEEVVAMGLFTGGNLFPVIPAGKKTRIRDILSAVGIAHCAQRYFAELSGGQKQRVLLARAIVSSPRILLLDEPTASIDYRAEKDIYEYLKQLNTQMTVLLVSHDVSVISTLVDRIVCLNRKAVTHTSAEVTGELLSRELYNTDVGVIHHTCHL